MRSFLLFPVSCSLSPDLLNAGLSRRHGDTEGRLRRGMRDEMREMRMRHEVAEGKGRGGLCFRKDR